MIVPKLEELNCSNCRASSMAIHYPEFFEYLEQTYPDLTHNERLYWYYNNITTRPVCNECGKETAFMNFRAGYREYCSNTCVNKSKDVTARKQETNIRKYGEDYGKVFHEKMKETCLERYGVENVFASDEIKSRIIETNRERFGCDYPMQSESVREKSKMTCLDKYGVEYSTQSVQSRTKKSEGKDGMIVKMKKTHKENYLSEHPEFIDMDKYSFTCVCCHPGCTKCIQKSFIIPKSVYYTRKCSGIELCTHVLPVDTSQSGTSPELFIRDILDRNSIEYETNTRKVIGPKELDIWIPGHNLAIECNGTYWHSSLYKDSNEHNFKWKSCDEIGIQLLTIWEDWVHNKREIVESLVLSKLGIYKTRIYARKCTVKEVSDSDSKEFLDSNHIQGYSMAKVRLGLYFEEELVSLMTFGKARKGIGSKNDNIELIRFCNKTHTQVIGGASRLFDYFINNYEYTSIVSYSSNDISNGALYKKLGFVLTNKSKASYWYVDKVSQQRYHRLNFTKSRLVAEGFDPSKSETQIMYDRGYLKIYDSGQQKWTYEKNTQEEPEI